MVDSRDLSALLDNMLVTEPISSAVIYNDVILVSNQDREVAPVEKTRRESENKEKYFLNVF